ncbi:hypothetical protein AMAG_08033 [Allomyces macrogynus ATCC 38327]|uniref:Nudix hydrolase domain-containing protein n=1 Tax=Allomyces macrogynus (strain ATCC 38327) TaxID=578462 RepID=A0A0L0SKC5_ALLM3|nr:hypothetical protein AMAG_08033 [Allomyces macrogynus ATCC 38327]|eukprot:KNE62855.1 hypothetical protein AMAG_08033 [Allomyces macrogynus ATCC 38327]
MKRCGFSANMWNGFGGKVDLTDASTESAAPRELQEECGLTSELVAAQPTDGLHGARAPYETEEMRPQWFDWDQVPFDKMWDDDRVWFPWLFRKEPLTVQVWFDGEVPAMVRYVIDVERTGERVVGQA